MADRPKPMVLIVRDGWGRNPNAAHDKFNAVKLAKTPVGDALLRDYPWTLIHTSGEDVGLPESTMGNSEVGHQNLGAGRVVDQESVRITKAIREGAFFNNEALVEAVDRAKANGKTVHLLGIASDAGVHGLLDHLYACIELCKQRGQTKVALHLFTDGRDTGPYSGKGFIERIEAKCKELGVGAIASIVGRYYAMDRDNRWERVKQAYDLLTGRGPAENHASAGAAVQDYYDHPTNDSQNGDEFITPRTVSPTNDAADTRIKDGDSVIFYNYRGDRPREITRAFMQPDFYGNVPPSPDSGEKGFDRGDQRDLRYVCLTAYEAGFAAFPGLAVAFPKPPKMTDIAGEYLSAKGLTQFRCAETEKFPHVTFFFNDYRDEPFEGERWEMAQSPKVATYDLQPEMSAPQITQIVLNRIAAEDCEDFILVNFANGDMVGHTGKLDAAIAAVESVDACVGKIVEAALKRGGKLIVTADHGNAEQMFDPDTGAAHTAHTLFPVECIIVDPDRKAEATGDPEKASPALHDGGKLADVLPTCLAMMGLEQPMAMTATSLIR
ncbi:2,3-bisphosphoglycerate-independent phosphoglycerate mutase [Phycisphaerales bacterium AB-hyl4]|uniref:2,3-bisphosphoglycerate-independent phosphoglycerate mutase n=1 Tax=Natronomicrosphaera hydrolytica TaxID=3242702 RepID=A0ABV4U183_9BACT